MIDACRGIARLATLKAFGSLNAINTLEDLEAIWATSPAPADRVLVAA